MTGGLRRLGARPDALALDASRARARGLIESAEREADAIRARARDEARVEYAAWIVAAQAAYARALHAEEPAVIALACEVARAVLGREAAAGPEVLRDVTSRAMARMRRASVVVLRVHPDDVAVAGREARGWLPEGMEGAETMVTGDASVERGGAVVETELGRVDARLSRLLEEVARILDGSRGVV